ncbi:hypothetical protein SAMN04488030_2551 [Aliiroseovarius halocynthiae]|nr:hypothetical protein SAMN04488030_2551 [Aliiroseovarius halocynthiae]
MRVAYFLDAFKTASKTCARVTLICVTVFLKLDMQLIGPPD